MPACISAIEYYLPETFLTNDDLQKEFPDYDFTNFESKVGIKKRHIVHEEETALDLAIKACEKLFKRIDKNEIDYILLCTQSPEYILPTTACILQARLQLRKNIGAFDFNLGCSGYTYGLSFANALITSGQAKNVLLVTAETYSTHIYHKDRSNRSIFGDASSASLVSFSEANDIGAFCFGTAGSGYDKLITKNGGSKYKFDAHAKEIEFGTNNLSTDNHLYMNGPEVFNFTIDVIPDFVNQIIVRNNIDIEHVDQYIFHQANKVMLNTLRQKLKIESSKFFIDIVNVGNTVSNTIPIALKEYSKSIEFGSSRSIILVGFGVGLSWCGGLVKVNKPL